MLCDISGLHKLTDFIDIDIISKLPAIRFSAQLSVQLLLLLSGDAAIPQMAAQAAGCDSWPFVFVLILLNDFALAVYGRLRDGVPDRNGLLS